MDWHTIHQRTLAFLDSEKHQLQHKVSQQRNGCCAAEWDLDVLESIIATQQAPDALSLESAVLCRLADIEKTIAALQWRRGHPSPPDYWRLECQRAFLGTLLRHYHAFRRNGVHNP